MVKLRVHGFAISIDGYGAGRGQNLANPLGVGGIALHEWAFATRTFKRMHGSEGGTTGIDDDSASRGFANIGAWILGRNMFGPHFVLSKRPRRYHGDTALRDLGAADPIAK
jgi:hypothetical protein